MARRKSNKMCGMSVRLSAAECAIVDRAARASGRIRTAFVREVPVRAAQDLLLDRVLVEMTPNGHRAFMAAIAEPAAPVSGVVDVLRRELPWA
jgi:uncharacterized protein (DUF1778 family)